MEELEPRSLGRRRLQHRAHPREVRGLVMEAGRGDKGHAPTLTQEDREDGPTGGAERPARMQQDAHQGL